MARAAQILSILLCCSVWVDPLPPAMTEILLPSAAAVGAVAWLAWNFLPMGKLEGQTLRLKDWRANRLAMQASAARAALEAVKQLPAAERLRALVPLLAKHGEVWVAGDSIRSAMIATGQDDALPWAEKFIAENRRCHLPGAALRACDDGAAQPHYRTQMFKLLQPFMDKQDGTSSSVNRNEVPRALLALDREWAAGLLTGPEYFTPGHPIFPSILQALIDMETNIPAMPPMENWPAHDHDEGRLRLLLARAVARQRPDEAAQQMKALMDSDLSIRVDAGREMAALLGLPDPDSIGGPSYRGGPANLNAHERSVQRAHLAHYALRDGDVTELLQDHELQGVSLEEIAGAFARVGAPAYSRLVRAFIGELGPLACEKDASLILAGIAARGEDFREKLRELDEDRHAGVTGSHEEEDLFIFHYMIEHESEFERS